MLGELAAVFGPAALEHDERERDVPVRQIAQAQWTRLDASSRALLRAFAGGIVKLFRRAHGCLQRYHVFVGDTVRPFFQFILEHFGYAAFNIRYNFITTFLFGEIFLQAPQVLAEQLVCTILNWNKAARQVYVDYLFHFTS